MAKKTTIKDLILDDKNFNKGSEFGNALIEKSMRKFGAGRSILIDKNNRVIAGNKSLENFSSIGLEDVQIVESDGKKLIAVRRNDIDLDSPEGREMALADNAAAKANIIFDAELIEAELGEAICEEWGVDLNKEEPEPEEDDFNGVTPKESITDLGDLYELNDHKLICGSSTETDTFEKLFNGQLADLVVTDPPYNVAYTGKTKDALTIKNDSMPDNNFYQFLYDFYSALGSYTKAGGSVTTIIAFDQLNRKGYLCELDPKYCDVIVARYINHRRASGSSLLIKRNGHILSDNEIEMFIKNTKNE